MRRILLLFINCLMALGIQAEVKLPKFFSDGMVLQQQTNARLWGWTKKGQTVTITTSWDGKTYLAKADKDGRFETTVSTSSYGGPYEITFHDGNQTRLRNILIGEVWICSGQSNMEMQMKGFKQQPVEGTTEELLNCNDPQLRLFTVGRAPTALLQQWDVKGQWNEAMPSSVRDFSATAYYFGRALRRLLGVPVGLIVTSYGGSACEAWMKREWLEEDSVKAWWPQHYPDVSFPITDQMVQKLQQRCPSALYNGQLKPLIGYAMRGVIWYQGEDNVPRYSYYAPLLKRMVDGWRSDWQQGEFPFYFCQIAPYDYSLIQWSGSQYLREQQLLAEKIITNARMAVLMDAGLEYGIHPRKKRQAGERLAVLALSNTYEQKGLPDFAVYKEVEFKNDTAIVSFDRSKEWVYLEKGPTVSDNFEIAGADRVFHPATKVWVSRNHIYVISDKVSSPVAVRYAFKDWVEGDLMHDGLPVSSFRTDNW